MCELALRVSLVVVVVAVVVVVVVPAPVVLYEEYADEETRRSGCLYALILKNKIFSGSLFKRSTCCM